MALIDDTMATNNNPPAKTSERRAFLFLTVFLAPLLAVAIVGAYGLMIWIFQMMSGPPTA